MSSKTHLPDPIVLKQMAVTSPELVAETDIAHIWRVQREDGSLAALKCYKNGDTKDETPGFDFLSAQDGIGAAHLYKREGAAFLMEWLDGVSLGDLVRGGDDETASHALVETANRLHAAPSQQLPSYDVLEARFQALFDATYSSDCPADVVATLRRATALAANLLADQSDPRPLHGDLHHDNIKMSARGYLAFDAKGVWGDRHFELANAFRNPLGAEDYYSRPNTILRRAEIWAAGFETSSKTLLLWAAAQSALSLAWSYDSIFDRTVTERAATIATLLRLIDGD